MSKHTPGPWIAKDGGRFDPEINITTESRNAADVLRICGIDVAFTGKFGDEQKANVHLIVAAPDVLNALQKATDALAGGLWDYGPGQDEHDQCDRVIEECRAAIAKATGETP